MNRAAPLILLLPVLILSVFEDARSQQSAFDRANEKMEEYRISEAVDLYRSIEREGHLSGKLFYNLGIAALYRDSLGLAKYYFMRSAGYPDTRTEADLALNSLESRFDRRSAVLPELPWERLFSRLEDSAGASGMIIFAILFFNLAAALLIGSWFFTNRAVLFRRFAWLAALSALLSMLASIHLQRSADRYATGVMIESRTPLLDRADRGSTDVSNVFEGYTMRVDLVRSRPDEGWYYVRLENGMYGWIDKEMIRIF